jgi:hypothetical protein
LSRRACLFSRRAFVPAGFRAGRALCRRGFLGPAGWVMPRARRLARQTKHRLLQCMHGVNDRSSHVSSADLSRSFFFVCRSLARQIEHRLFQYIHGGPLEATPASRLAGAGDPTVCCRIKEGSRINTDVTGPGAVLALGLMYLRTGHAGVAARLQVLPRRPGPARVGLPGTCPAHVGLRDVHTCFACPAHVGHARICLCTSAFVCARCSRLCVPVRATRRR